MDIMKIAETLKGGMGSQESIFEQAAQPKGEGFASVLQNSMSDVNKLLVDADKKSIEQAVGKSENLHDATIAFEKAETAFKLLVQVRNKVIDAYHEIMRMQV